MACLCFIVTTISFLFFYGNAQSHPCVYSGGPNNNYTLNLTIMSDWLMSLVTPDYDYYYTPCGNREICVQGNKQTASNVVQYLPKTDQCEYYLSIDHQDPAQYAFGFAAWRFDYKDGEVCQQTNQPRTTTIFYTCDEYLTSPAWFYAAAEYPACNYRLELRSPLACVPENSLNAKCQWRFKNYTTNNTYNLDLSSLSGKILYSVQNNNQTGGYLRYYSPCGNNLQCYQQQETTPNVMSMVENTKTGACDTYLGIWEEGRVQPVYKPDEQYWMFNYINGRRCSNGQVAQETIRYYCDESADEAKIISATWNEYCYWTLSIATKVVCQNAKRGANYFYTSL